MKNLLFTVLAGIISLSAFTQHKFATITGPGRDSKVRQELVQPDGIGPYSGAMVPGQKLFDNTIIGSTWYDVQSYTNVMQRIWAYPDGTVGATWMCAGQGVYY